MTNYKIRGGGKLTLIEDFVATGTFTTKTFTFTSDFTKFSQYKIIVDGVTTAQLAILMRINGLSTSTYNDDGSNMTGGTETLINNSGQTSNQPMAAACSGADTSIAMEINFFASKGGTTDNIIMSAMTTTSLPAHQNTSHNNNTDLENITEVIIYVSTSSLKTGARLSLYKIAR